MLSTLSFIMLTCMFIPFAMDNAAKGYNLVKGLISKLLG